MKPYVVVRHRATGLLFRAFAEGQFHHLFFSPIGCFPWDSRTGEFATSPFRAGGGVGYPAYGSGASGQLYTHAAIGQLFRPVNRTGAPAHIQGVHVFDHINSDTMDWRLCNLRSATMAENVQAPHRLARQQLEGGAGGAGASSSSSSSSSSAGATDSTGGEATPALPALPSTKYITSSGRPIQGSYVPTTRRLLRNESGEIKEYRFSVASDPYLGRASDVGVPSDGGPLVRLVAGRLVEFKPKLSGDYEMVKVGDRLELLEQVHILVGYLWGAPNHSGHPMSSHLVVNHIGGPRSGYALSNLEFLAHSGNVSFG
jgi:hypothetical protein